jgi:hypothetical protein
VPDRVATGDSGVAGWISAELQQNVVQPIVDFQNPDQEWRRLFSELFGTFLPVMVAAGGGMMGAAFPNTISRTAAVVAPGLMSAGNHHVHGEGLGRSPEPRGQHRVRAAARLSVASGAGLHHRPADWRDPGGTGPARGDQRVGRSRFELRRFGIQCRRGVLDGVAADVRAGERDPGDGFGGAEHRDHRCAWGWARTSPWLGCGEVRSRERR